MNIVAHHRNARMAPRKIRPWRSVLIGLPVHEASVQLAHAAGKAPQLLGKVLTSAVANAKNNFELEEEQLVVDSVIVNEGIKFKRFRPVYRGMAHPYRKQLSHISIAIKPTDPALLKKGKATKKKTDIETLSTEDLGSGKAPSEPVETPDEESTGAESTGRGKKMEAYQKVKTQQQGGDKKKRFRRKSI